MKIFVIRFSDLKYLAAITVLVCLVFAVGLSNVDVAAVFGAKKLLPIYSVDRSDKVVSITFDCAWGAGDIPNILETLKKENVKATFFLVGQWAEKNPDAVKMMAADGHDVANHSYSHLKMGALDRSRISSEITKCNEVLKRLTGKSNDLFRPPYGDYNRGFIQFSGMWTAWTGSPA